MCYKVAESPISMLALEIVNIWSQAHTVGSRANSVWVLTRLTLDGRERSRVRDGIWDWDCSSATYGATEATSASSGVSSVVESVGRWKDTFKGRGVALTAARPSA